MCRVWFQAHHHCRQRCCDHKGLVATVPPACSLCTARSQRVSGSPAAARSRMRDTRSTARHRGWWKLTQHKWTCSMRAGVQGDCQSTRWWKPPRRAAPCCAGSCKCSCRARTPSSWAAAERSTMPVACSRRPSACWTPSACSSRVPALTTSCVRARRATPAPLHRCAPHACFSVLPAAMRAGHASGHLSRVWR